VPWLVHLTDCAVAGQVWEGHGKQALGPHKSRAQPARGRRAEPAFALLLPELVAGEGLCFSCASRVELGYQFPNGGVAYKAFLQKPNFV